MSTWRDLGLGRGHAGTEFSPLTVACPYCGTHGKFTQVYRGESHSPDDPIPLMSDVWQCLVCSHFAFVIWRSEEGFHDYRIYPYGRPHSAAHPSWPAHIGEGYVKALNALLTEDWGSALVLARHTLSVACRDRDASPDTLSGEIRQLAGRGLLPAVMAEWAGAMPQIQDSDTPASAESAREIIRFTRYLLDTLYTLPHDYAHLRQSP